MNRISAIVLIYFGLFVLSGQIVLAEENIGSITLMPGRYVFVKDDAEKFREDNWMKDRFAAGISNFTMSRVLNGTALDLSGHAIVDENNLGLQSSFIKEDKYALRMGYDEFRHYYDGTGGKFRDFTMPVELDKHLVLNRGEIFTDFILPISETSNLLFRYDREFKQGAKSRLTWGSFTEGGVTRKVTPSWQDIDERVDKFTLGAEQELKGFKLGLSQTFESFRAETFREERDSTPAFIRQSQDPRAKLITTTLKAERDFSDKFFFSSAYRFSKLESREIENIADTSGTKNYYDASAENDFNTHTATGNFLFKPFKKLVFNLKTKAELLDRKSNSLYPNDKTSPSPDGIVDDFINSDNKNDTLRFGEGVSVRFTGLPHTALYLEAESEQARILLREDRSVIGNAPNEIFNRRTVTDARRSFWAAGSNIYPMKKINITSQFRQIFNNNDYDDQQETNPGSTTARSAFIDSQKYRIDEFSTKISMKPLRWVQNAFRYQLRNQKFLSRVEAQDTVEADYISHTYTTDLIITPTDKLSISGSFSKQQAVTDTAARLVTGANVVPAYDASVNTVLVSADYALSKKVSLTGAYQWSGTDNFNDFSTVGMPYGLKNDLQHVTLSLRYALGEDAAIQGRYGYHTYQEESNGFVDDYIANVIALEASIKF